MLNRKLEVLAPAGSPQALEAAVACGADAVYLGIGALNARRNAENFTAQGLSDLVRRCHIRGVKVYLTLNIVMLENEIGQLLEAARAACEAGVDAVIVQDLGIASILRRCAPGLRLNASTQMAVHNADGVKLCEDLGFSRVVLARECSRDEIARIVESTPLEVEVFVHGALCMSVSGQCYMSAVLGQRSGNRGLCAQPCRLDFSTQAADHALSLKDMSSISRIAELKRIGVASLKIEGRMKRPEYVAAAVTACRAAIAGETPDMESLQAVFSRSGFTDGYFTGERDLFMFGIRGKEDVTAAAGVLGKLANLYNEPKHHVQKVGIDLAFAMKAGHPSFLSVVDSDGNSVCAEGPVPEAALNKPTDAERAKVNLEKTGNTPYKVQDIRCSIDDGLILPASAINALRRDALAQLDELRGTPHTVPFDAELLTAPQGAKHAALPELRVRARRLGQVSDKMYQDAELVTLPAGELEKLFADGAPEQTGKLCVGIPRMLFDGREALVDQLRRLRELGVEHASAGNLGALRIARELGFRVHGEPFLNIVNSWAANALAELGAEDICLSYELSLDAMRRLKVPVPYGLTVYGYLPLMTVRNCPVKAAVGCARCKSGENLIIDRKGAKLRANCAYGCSEILNPVPLFMGDRLNELDNLDFVELCFTTEQAEACASVFRAYQEGGEQPSNFTRGLLYKTIL